MQNGDLLPKKNTWGLCSEWGIKPLGLPDTLGLQPLSRWFKPSSTSGRITAGEGERRRSTHTTLIRG